MKRDVVRGARPRRSFTPEFKVDAVGLVKSGKTLSQVARELDLMHPQASGLELHGAEVVATLARRRLAFRTHLTGRFNGSVT